MRPSRRDVLRYGAVTLAQAVSGRGTREATEVNDVHSQLNATRVARVERPESVEQLRAAILEARREKLALSISAAGIRWAGSSSGMAWYCSTCAS